MAKTVLTPSDTKSLGDAIALAVQTHIRFGHFSFGYVRDRQLLIGGTIPPNEHALTPADSYKDLDVQNGVCEFIKKVVENRLYHEGIRIETLPEKPAFLQNASPQPHDLQIASSELIIALSQHMEAAAPLQRRAMRDKLIQITDTEIAKILGRSLKPLAIAESSGLPTQQ